MPIISLLFWNAGVGAVIAVDDAMATAAMFVALAKVTATVRAGRSAFCAFALVVMPLATVTVQSDTAGSVCA